MRIKLIGAAVAAAILVSLAGRIVEVNSAGYYQVIQAVRSGDLSVRMEPGLYWPWFDTITTYAISDIYDFGEDKIRVRFNDASTADIPGQIKYRLPSAPAQLLKIHQDFRSDKAVHTQAVRQVVANAIMQAAKYFRAEDVYSTRSSEFLDLVNDQIKEGIYATTYSEEYRKDDLDPTKTNLVKQVRPRLDDNGKRIVNEVSLFDVYGIELVQLSLGNPDFDEKTDALIAERKDAEQKRVVAIANAEKAKQDTITAREVGMANVAKAEAEALVLAKTAVVEAEKNTKIAKEQALQADEQKKAIIARGEADAAATKLKVAAGLSPLEKAQIDKDTAIGVAQALATVKMPRMMVLGGGQGGAINPWDAMGMQAFHSLSKQMASVGGAQ